MSSGCYWINPNEVWLLLDQNQRERPLELAVLPVQFCVGIILCFTTADP